MGLMHFYHIYLLLINSVYNHSHFLTGTATEKPLLHCVSLFNPSNFMSFFSSPFHCPYFNRLGFFFFFWE